MASNVVTNFFERMTPQRRKAYRDHYIRIIAIASGEHVEYNKQGQPIKPGATPWMVPFWTEGLTTLEAIMIGKGEL